MVVISISIIVVLLMAVTALPISKGQVDDFENGTTQGWSSGSQNPYRPSNVSTGGLALGTYGDTGVVLKIVSASSKSAAELTGAAAKAVERFKNARRERLVPSILPGTSLFFCMRGLFLHCLFLTAVRQVSISGLRYYNRQPAIGFHQPVDYTFYQRLHRWHRKNNYPLDPIASNRQSIGFHDVLMAELTLKIKKFTFRQTLITDHA